MNYIRKTARFDGVRYQAYGKTEAEAVAKLAEKLAEAKQGLKTTGGNMTVSAWFEEWLVLYKKPKGLTEKSLSMYRQKYDGYIRPRIGGMRLKDVRDVHLQRILNGQAGSSASSVKKLMMVMREMFKRARQSRLIPYDPAELLELPTVTEGHRRSLTDAERDLFLEVAETHPAGLWIKTLLYTGMRPGETFALNWADVDFKKNESHGHAAVESGSNKIKAPKTAAGVRDIPIHAALLPLLLKASEGAQPFSPVFRKEHGGRMDADLARRRWKSFLRAADIKAGAELHRNKITVSKLADDLTPYMLRHTFCTDLQAAGVPLNVAKELMGHADISTTANIYTHKDSAVLHAGISLLDGTAGVKSGVTASAASL